MIIAIVLLAAALGIVFGYAVRQRQTLRENADTIQERSERIEGLIRENEGLRLDKKAHETSLEMVLDELGTSE